MKKKIEFDADLRNDVTIGGDYIICQKAIPVTEEWARVHVILSPVEDPERNRREPDYKAMWVGLGMYVRGFDVGGKIRLLDLRERIAWLELKHTPQAGVKKEE